MNGDLWDDDGATLYVGEDGTLHVRYLDDGRPEPDDDGDGIPYGVLGAVVAVIALCITAVVTAAYCVGRMRGAW